MLRVEDSRIILTENSFLDENKNIFDDGCKLRNIDIDFSSSNTSKLIIFYAFSIPPTHSFAWNHSFFCLFLPCCSDPCSYMLRFMQISSLFEVEGIEKVYAPRKKNSVSRFPNNFFLSHSLTVFSSTPTMYVVPI